MNVTPVWIVNQAQLVELEPCNRLCRKQQLSLSDIPSIKYRRVPTTLDARDDDVVGDAQICEFCAKKFVADLQSTKYAQ